MKTLITILLITILFSCKNDSFEDYIEWCEETTMEEVVYCYSDFEKIHWIEITSDIEQLNNDIADTTKRIYILDVHIRNVPYEEPTIKGYQIWLEDKGFIEYTLTKNK